VPALPPLQSHRFHTFSSPYPRLANQHQAMRHWNHSRPPKQLLATYQDRMVKCLKRFRPPISLPSLILSKPRQHPIVPIPHRGIFLSPPRTFRHSHITVVWVKAEKALKKVSTLDSHAIINPLSHAWVDAFSQSFNASAAGQSTQRRNLCQDVCNKQYPRWHSARSGEPAVCCACHCRALCQFSRYFPDLSWIVS
jgi:hypothetical protein